MSDREESRDRRDRIEARWGALMVRAQRGDGTAYETLLNEALPVLRGFVRTRLRDASGEEDVVQNVLVSIHRARHTYERGRPFGAWIRAIARNAVVDAQRARSRRALREVPAAEADAFPAPAADPPPGAALSPRLRRALESLPPSQRQAVELIQLRGLSVAEAADAVGVKPGALRVRAHRGYRALRALLGGRRQ
jgi:RNA polymerase sigma-70 factor (ECF subfamily)